MTASVSIAAGLDGTMLRNARFLAEPRKRVVLAEECDDRAAFTGFADDRGRDARDTFGDTKALVAQFRGLFGGRAHLGVVRPLEDIDVVVTAEVTADAVVRALMAGAAVGAERPVVLDIGTGTGALALDALKLIAVATRPGTSCACPPVTVSCTANASSSPVVCART